jgi:hypothetical protein
VSTVDVVDETFLAVPPVRAAAAFADPAAWRRFWPDLVLSVVTDRGDKGFRWTVQGALVGSMEVWLEPEMDGTVLHYYLRADPSDSNGRPVPLPPRRALEERARRQRAAKAIALGLKDELEEGRAPGEPPAGISVGSPDAARPATSDPPPPDPPPPDPPPPDQPPPAPPDPPPPAGRAPGRSDNGASA